MPSPVKERVMIVDDELTNVQILGQFLRDRNLEISVATSGKEALQRVKYAPPDIILMDVMMPDMDGFETVARIQQEENLRSIPVIYITALHDIAHKTKAFESGGHDYIIKPFNPTEVLYRVNTHLELSRYRRHLEDLVNEQIAEITTVTEALVSVLESANFYKDDITGHHIRRVAEYCRILGQELSIEKKHRQEIHQYASLHDIGKIGVPDSILGKPAALTKEERTLMEQHCEIGYKMLDRPGIPQTARNIVRHHHERWDGTGYPRRLNEQKIPIEARIVALADVYDALRSRRPYKPGYTHEETCGVIAESSGTHFDPELVNCFLKAESAFHDVFMHSGETTV